jgi:hypothetical protein
MSHPSERRAIIEIYERIEREIGWGATSHPKGLPKASESRMQCLRAADKLMAVSLGF